LDVLMSHPLCPLEKHWTDVTIGWLIVFGNIVTVLPQLAILLKTRSNTGLNLWTVLLSCISTGTTFLNALDNFWGEFYCCGVTSLSVCNNLLVAFYGLASWFLCWQAIYVCSLLAWPPVETESELIVQNRQRYLHTGVFIAYMIVLFGCITVVVVTNTHYAVSSTFYITMDSIWGITSAISTAAIWIPQVYTTYTLKDTGSLSMSLVAFTALGTGITVYNLVRYGATFWIWVPQVIAGFFCLVLIGLGGLYAYQQKRTLLEFLWPSHTVVEEVETDDLDPDGSTINPPNRRTSWNQDSGARTEFTGELDINE